MFSARVFWITYKGCSTKHFLFFWQFFVDSELVLWEHLSRPTEFLLLYMGPAFLQYSFQSQQVFDKSKKKTFDD